MNETKPIKLFIFLGILVSLLLTAAVPLPNQSLHFNTGRSDLVRLIIDNQSSSTLYLRLNGPAFYYMVVKANDAEVFTVQRGKYDQTLTACGDTVESKLDMTTSQTLVMPKCGSKSPTSGVIDLGHLVIIVKIKVKNDSDSKMIVVFEGPATYVFSFDKDQKKTYTVAKGTYHVTYYACGKTGERRFNAYHGKELTLGCPK